MDAPAGDISENGGIIDEVFDSDDDRVVCRVCGRGDEDGRAILRFLPVEHDLAAANAAPSVQTFSQDIGLHVFCGKTASILPSVNQPDLEILTKAGLKNKHGIGAEVNAALARTRCAISQQEGAKEKHYYLVREFEAHLAAIRHISITFGPDNTATSNLNDPYQADLVDTMYVPVMGEQLERNEQPTPRMPPHAQTADDYGASTKVLPIRAAAGMIQKSSSRNDATTMPYGSQVTEDGKVRCGCGGTHLPPGTTKGVQSWRSHVTTKRHQKWMEENGMLGAV